MNKYRTPGAFKTALEHRLKVKARLENKPYQRVATMAVFERLLVRLTLEFGSTLTIKGGYALELRLKQARATQDLDLHLFGAAQQTLERLQRAGQMDADDFMAFEISVHPQQPDILAEGLPYEGKRYQVTPKLAGKVFPFSHFVLDIVFAEDMLAAPEEYSTSNDFDFAGLFPATLKVYPLTTHIAEKLHAYTYLRTNNSRVKDLPDLALLAQTGKPLEAGHLYQIIQQKFKMRNTHDVPPMIPLPPSHWEAPYKTMAQSQSLPWQTLTEVHQVVSEFLNPVLARQTGYWVQQNWRWI